MPADRTTLWGIGLAVLALAAVGWGVLDGDQHRAFRSIAYPCLPLDATTTDPAECIMVSGLRAPPTEHVMPDGSVVYPVFSHPDPEVVPRVHGRTLYFPAKFLDDFGLQTPPLPPHGRPLPAQQRAALVRYLPEQTRAGLAAALEGGD